jgi:hypothetical protein
MHGVTHRKILVNARCRFMHVLRSRHVLANARCEQLYALRNRQVLRHGCRNVPRVPCELHLASGQYRGRELRVRPGLPARGVVYLFRVFKTREGII